MILKKLSLSEKNLLELKHEKDCKIIVDKGNKIDKNLTIKFIIFFILGNLFMIIFWYYIAAFCGVYTNTQWILIKDTLVSFGLSMLYPFGLNLLPGFLRIPALKAKNTNKKCLYKISTLVAII